MKEILREKFLNQLKSSNFENSRVEALNFKLIDYLHEKEYENIMAFYPKSFEVQINKTLIDILQSKNQQLFLPRVNGQNLDVYKISNLENDLVNGSFGLMEPSLSLEKVDKEFIDCVICPGVCFDKNGFRIGFGKGFYDRFLKDFQGQKIGVCYTEFLVEDCFPSEFDIKMDHLIYL